MYDINGKPLHVDDIVTLSPYKCEEFSFSGGIGIVIKVDDEYFVKMNDSHLSINNTTIQLYNIRK